MANPDRPTYCHLRRKDTATPWGFRMQGGNEYGSTLYIQKVNNKSIAHKCGLQIGDAILRIGKTSTKGMTHEQAKMEIIRAGNELDILVKRNVVPQEQTVDRPDGRSELSEESTQYRGYTNPNVQSRSFKILQESLSFSEADENEAGGETEMTNFRMSQSMYSDITNQDTSSVFQIPKGFWDHLAPLPMDM